MSKFLDDFKEYILQNGENIYTVGEYRMGEMPRMIEIAECNPCNNLYSVAKVFTVTAIGMRGQNLLILPLQNRVILPSVQ